MSLTDRLDVNWPFKIDNENAILQVHIEIALTSQWSSEWLQKIQEGQMCHIIQCVTIQHSLSGERAVDTEITPSPSVSILGCEHTES